MAAPAAARRRGQRSRGVARRPRLQRRRGRGGGPGQRPGAGPRVRSCASGARARMARRGGRAGEVLTDGPAAREARHGGGRRLGASRRQVRQQGSSATRRLALLPQGAGAGRRRALATKPALPDSAAARECYSRKYRDGARGSRTEPALSCVYDAHAAQGAGAGPFTPTEGDLSVLQPQLAAAPAAPPVRGIRPALPGPPAPPRPAGPWWLVAQAARSPRGPRRWPAALPG